MRPIPPPTTWILLTTCAGVTGCLPGYAPSETSEGSTPAEGSATAVDARPSDATADSPLPEGAPSPDATIPPGGDATVCVAQGTGAVGVAGCACSTAGATACAGNMQTAQLICLGGLWTANGTCAAGEYCDTNVGAQQGTCHPVATPCRGAAPGDFVCVDPTNVGQCGADLVTTTPVSTCPSGCCGGSCVDLTKDGNCGRCGHGCQGGACLAGACQPVTLSTTPAGYDVVALVVAVGRVYWAFSTSLLATPVDGGPETTIAAQNGALGMGADSERVYFVEGNSTDIASVPLDGGSVATLVSGTTGPYWLAPGQSQLVWVDLSYSTDRTGRILSAPLGGVADGQAPTALSPTLSGLNRLVVDSTSAYFTSGCFVALDAGCTGAIYRSPLVAEVDGGSAVPIMNTEAGTVGPEGLALANGSLYWAAKGLCADDAGADWGGLDTYCTAFIGSLGLDGGATTLAITRSVYPTYGPGAAFHFSGNMAADSHSVYWPTGHGIESVPVEGGAVTTLASGLGTMMGFSTDDTSIYWSEVNCDDAGFCPSSIRKVAKP